MAALRMHRLQLQGANAAATFKTQGEKQRPLRR
jgi:hypothetical protein